MSPKVSPAPTSFAGTALLLTTDGEAAALTMQRHDQPPLHPTLTFALPLLAVLGGCANEKELTEICEWVNSPNECDMVDTDDGETGDEPESDYPPCTLSGDGQARTVYQCDGEFSASLSFNTLLGDCAQTFGDASLCTEDHTFGVLDEPYEMPAVMACCDPDAPPSQDELLQYCSSDVIEQLCRSVTTRLQNLIDDGKFPVGENQAQKLQNWLADNLQACYSKLYQPTDIPGSLAEASWLVNDGKNGDWTLLNDFTITLEHSQVDSATLPAGPADYLSCQDNDYNNTEIFEDEVPTTPGFGSVTYLIDSPLATVTGPELLGERVSAVGRFASLTSGCTEPWCSRLELSTDDSSDLWSLEELELFGDGPVNITHGSASITVERVAIRLYEGGLGTTSEDRSGARVYTLRSGEAHFVISGVGAGPVYDLRWANNASPITVHDRDDRWMVDSFTIEHVDRNGETWTIAVPSTTWN